MRRYLKPITLLALSISVILICLGLLREFDYVLVTYKHVPSYPEYENIKNRVADAAPFSRSANVPVHTEFRSVPDVTVYRCDEGLKDYLDMDMLTGRFLWNRDVEDNRPFAVIEEKMAVLLFSNTDCIGRSLYIQGTEFKVIGVVAVKDGLLDVLTGIDKYAIYLPYESTTGASTVGGCIYRANNPVLINAITNLPPSYGYVQSVDRISLRSKMVALFGRLSIFVIWVLVLVFVIRSARVYLQRYISRIRTELYTQYFSGYLRAQWPSLVLHLMAAASITSLFVLWYHLVRFQPEMDPDLVPPQLTDLKSWSERIADYIRTSNTRISIPLKSSILIDKMRFFMIVAAITSILSASHLLKIAHNALVALMNRKQNSDL